MNETKTITMPEILGRLKEKTQIWGNISIGLLNKTGYTNRQKAEMRKEIEDAIDNQVNFIEDIVSQLNKENHSADGKEEVK